MPTAFLNPEGNTVCSESLCCRRTLRGLSPQACTETFCTETGRSQGCLLKQAASGSPRTHADDERSWEVGPIRSTGETAEQSGQHAAEVVEERDWAKGNSAKRDKLLDTEPDGFAQCAGASRPSAPLRPLTRGKSRIWEICTSGSVRGVGSDPHSYRDKISRSSFDGADGVVVQLQQIFLILSNHPVSGHKVANAAFC